MCVCLETRSAVVELGHPWKSVTMQRKLPPLKYYYDLKMGEAYTLNTMLHLHTHYTLIYTHTETSTFVWSHGPCLEPALSQTNIALSKSLLDTASYTLLHCFTLSRSLEQPYSGPQSLPGLLGQGAAKTLLSYTLHN